MSDVELQNLDSPQPVLLLLGDLSLGCAVDLLDAALPIPDTGDGQRDHARQKSRSENLAPRLLESELVLLDLEFLLFDRDLALFQRQR